MRDKLPAAAATVSAMTMLSRVSGLARDMVFARFLGSGLEADVFFVAFRVPNLFRRVFGEGAFSMAFIPVFTGVYTAGDAAQTRAFIGGVAVRLALALALVSAAGVAAAPALVAVVAPGFVGDPVKFDLAADALRLTFPYLFFISFVAMAAGMLNTAGKFAAPAATPVLLNLCLIAAVVYFAPLAPNPAVGVALGVPLAGAVQLLFQLPFLKKEKLLFTGGGKPRQVDQQKNKKNIGEVFKLMAPAAFGASVNQINMLVSTLLASFLATGSVSWLYYSDRLMELPLGVFSVALGTVLLPSLSRSHKNNSPAEFSRLVDWGGRLTLLIILPAAAGLFVLSAPLLSTLFQYGEFGAGDVQKAAQSLRVFAVGLIGFAAIKVLGPAFYARKNTRTPVKIACVSVAVNIVLGIVLSRHFQHVGLAAATSIAAWVNAALLLAVLWRGGVWRPAARWPRFLLQVAAATAVMALLVAWGAGGEAGWTGAGAALRAGRLLLWIALGMVCYTLALWLGGVRPAQLTTTGFGK
ncbi:MAG: murein biosynthesis integral membrane protein MurJ [Gammaproteobacteria bacterium]|nr:murein biosynthesis integral membrane protein MurJ [Gammaproteobacteria bacterium]